MHEPVPKPSRSGGAASPAVSTLARALQDPSPLMKLVWAVLAGVPVLWVIEYIGPRWLNLVLRGMWVVAAAAAVAISCVVVVRNRKQASRRR